MTSQLRPKVRVDVQSAINLIAGTGPATVAMLGTAKWGPLNTITTITNLSEAIENFGDDVAGDSLSLIKGLDLFYKNSGATVKCVRLADSDAAKSTLGLDSGSTSDVVTITGKYYGTYGDNIMVTVTANGDARDVTITDGVKVETYDNSGNGYDSNYAITQAITADSALVTATTTNNTYIIDALSQTNLSGGDNGDDGLVASDYTDSLDAELLLEDFDILVIPGETEDSFHTSVVGKINSRAQNEEKFAIFVSGISKDETIATASARTSSGQNLSLVAPNVVYENRISGTDSYLDGSYLACAYAGVLAGLFPGKAATHKTINVDGISILESALTKYYNNGEQNQLLNSRIVPIAKIGGVLRPARAVTRHATITDVYFEQNIVTIINYVKTNVYALLNGYIGKANLSRIRSIIAKNIDGLLEQYKIDEVVNEYQPTVVTEGSSPDTINVAMVVKPAFALNFINVTLTISNVDAS